MVMWFMASCWTNDKQLIATATKQNGFSIKEQKADRNTKLIYNFYLKKSCSYCIGLTCCLVQEIKDPLLYSLSMAKLLLASSFLKQLHHPKLATLWKAVGGYPHLQYYFRVNIVLPLRAGLITHSQATCRSPSTSQRENYRYLFQ